MACVDVTGSDAGDPMRTLPSFDLAMIFNGLGTTIFLDKDRSGDSTRGKGSNSFTLGVLLGSRCGIGLGGGRGRSTFGTTVGKRPGRDVCFVGSLRGPDDRSSVDIPSGVHDSLRTGVLYVFGPCHFVEIPQTMNGLGPAIVYDYE